MNYASHTPGPWKMQELLDHEGGGPYYRITGEPTLFLDVVECSDGYVPGENLANARLIRAAPELLSALRGLLMVTSPPADISGQRHVEYARDVVAWATGWDRRGEGG